jgi:branched-subunit amino acid aminotransferase/4-amino-4-deoxychorismate lyase
MRALVLELAPRLNIAVRIATVTPHDLEQAESVWVTNVRLGLQPVHWYRDRRLAVDPRAARLQECIDATVA